MQTDELKRILPGRGFRLPCGDQFEIVGVDVARGSDVTGVVRCEVSPDGEHWQPADPMLLHDLGLTLEFSPQGTIDAVAWFSSPATPESVVDSERASLEDWVAAVDTLLQEVHAHARD